ncbi:unnamed protein product [Paramecium pentaurelia]|uniref:Uncharacterized protein n=1 Tax=Paramecium pentaurelia TaxID=43138 RepID=A0A8S1TPJ4_9CILI|nr:unnamed protein product [Paramecium pentaurelia]
MKHARFNNQSNSPREIGLFRQCIRFQPKERSPQPNEEDAMIYSKLRRFGLVRDKALKYCLADHCKIDASQCRHGPPNFKIFQTSLDKQKIIRGWQMVGKLKERSSEKFQKAKGDDGLMQYRNQEEQKKFERLKNYFLGLSNSSKQVKLPQFQMGNGKDHYFELADYYEQIKPLSRTLITDTESFDDIIPKYIREQFRIEPRVQRPGLKRTDEEKGLKSRLKALNELIETYREAGSPNDPSIEILMMKDNVKNFQVQVYQKSKYLMRKEVQLQKRDAVFQVIDILSFSQEKNKEKINNFNKNLINQSQKLLVGQIVNLMELYLVKISQIHDNVLIIFKLLLQLMRETAFSSSPFEKPNKLTSGLFRDCQRFIPRRKFTEENQENATVFAKLRRAGLDKKKALKYCQAQHCKLDTTQNEFGPPGYKIFKQNYDPIKQYQGWQLNGKIKLKDQFEYERISKDINLGLRQQPNEDLYQLYNRLAETHRKTEERCNFTELSRQELIMKLRSLTRDDNRKYNTPIYQLRRHNEIYYELADYFEKQQPPQIKSLVTELEAFDDIVPKKYIKQFYLEQKSTGNKKKNLKHEASEKIQRRSRILMELTALFSPVKSDNSNRRSFYTKQDQMWQVQNDSAITSLLDMDESNNSRNAERNSIFVFRFAKVKQTEEQERINQFQDSLKKVIQKNIENINYSKKSNKYFN